MFRKTFNYDKCIFWYPPHQAKALRQLKNGVNQIDYVVEVRDARIPYTSINHQFDQILGHRERLVVYNKSDLSNHLLQKPLQLSLLKHRNEHCIFTSATKDINLELILSKAIDKCNSNPLRYPYLSLVVVGLPNVGKSSIINLLRNKGVKRKSVAAVGKTAGITQTIQTRIKIFENPAIYLVDTPGIFDPQISTPIQGLKISLVGCTKDKLTESVNVADYLLFRLNLLKQKHYPNVLNIEPTDDIYSLLGTVAQRNNFLVDTNSRLYKTAPKNNMIYNLDRAALYVLDLFRLGKFGPLTLDNINEFADSIEPDVR
jgi:ribosome biogenesis GTPase A